MSLFTVHIHVDSPPELEEELHLIQLALRRIEEKLRKIMATEAEVLEQLEEANNITNEIATDLQTLIDQLAQVPDVPTSVTASLSALVTKLQGVAAVVP